MFQIKNVILFCIKGRNLLENEIDDIIHKKFKNDNIEKKSNRKALSTKNVVTSINLERSTNKKRKKKKNQNNKKQNKRYMTILKLTNPTFKDIKIQIITGTNKSNKKNKKNKLIESEEIKKKC